VVLLSEWEGGFMPINRKWRTGANPRISASFFFLMKRRRTTKRALLLPYFPSPQKKHQPLYYYSLSFFIDVFIFIMVDVLLGRKRPVVDLLFKYVFGGDKLERECKTFWQ